MKRGPSRCTMIVPTRLVELSEAETSLGYNQFPGLVTAGDIDVPGQNRKSANGSDPVTRVLYSRRTGIRANGLFTTCCGGAG